MFLHPNVTSSYALEWKPPDVDATTQFLCRERDFSEDRVTNALDRMITGLRRTEKRTTLESFFR
jgi:flap endonuclease-1